MKRISSQIMFLIIALTLSTSFIIGTFIYANSSKYIREETEKKLSFMSSSYASSFSQRFIEVETAVDILHAYIRNNFDPGSLATDQSYIDAYENELNNVFRDIVLTHRYFSGLYFTFNPDVTGKVHEVWYLDLERTGVHQRVDKELYNQFRDIPATGDDAYPSIKAFYPENPAMGYYYVPVAKKTGVWYEPYDEDGLPIITTGYSRAVFINDLLIGVIGIDINIEDITRTISKMKVLDRGYAFLLTPDLEVVSHPLFEDRTSLLDMDPEMYQVLKVLKEPVEIAGIVEGTDSHGKAVYGYGLLTNGWILILCTDWEEIYEPINDLAVVILIIASLIIIISIAFAYGFSNRIAIPVETAVEELRHIEIGDFTHQIPAALLDREDELGTFIKSVSAMKGVIKELMKELEYSTSQPELIMTLINEMADTTLQASEEAASAVQGIAAEGISKEEKLRKTNYWLLKAQHIGNIGTWENDLSSGKMHWSSEMFRILGRSIDEKEPDLEQLFSRVHSEDRERITGIFGQAITEGSYSQEYRFHDFSGRMIWVYEVGEVINNPGDTPACVYGICQDITERKKTLEELEALNSNLSRMVKEEVEKNRQKDAALTYQSRLAKMGEMIAHIAHQWRQPLNNLGLILSNIRETCMEERIDTQDLEQSIRRSEVIIQKMSQTINDFRYFLRPKEKKETFSLLSSIQFITGLIENSLKMNKISITIDLEKDSELYGYSNEFSQVISNILYNARDALMINGSMNRLIRVSVGGDENRAFVRIWNNGPPISGEALVHLFQPYFSTKTDGEGTGIGLYMSKLIIEKHFNGAITMENLEDGVICRIDVPVMQGNTDNGI